MRTCRRFSLVSAFSSTPATMDGAATASTRLSAAPARAGSTALAHGEVDRGEHWTLRRYRHRPRRPHDRRTCWDAEPHVFGLRDSPTTVRDEFGHTKGFYRTDSSNDVIWPTRLLAFATGQSAPPNLQPWRSHFRGHSATPYPTTTRPRREPRANARPLISALPEHGYTPRHTSGGYCWTVRIVRAARGQAVVFSQSRPT